MMMRWRSGEALVAGVQKLLAPGEPQRDPVDHHGDQDDDDAGEQGLAELGLAHRGEDLPADVVEAADDGRDDDHGQSGHGGLVDAHHDLRQGGRDLHLPEALPRRGAAHARGLDDVGRDAAQAEHDVAHHGRGRVDGARDHAHHGSEPEQEEDRNQVGEGRHRLHQVETGFDDPVGPIGPIAPDPEAEAQRHGQGHRDPDQGQGVHALGPVAGDHHVEERGGGEDREPPPGGAERQRRERGQGRRPGQPLQQALELGHGPFEQPGEDIEQPFEGPHEPIHGRIDRVRDRLASRGGRGREPSHRRAHAQDERSQDADRGPGDEKGGEPGRRRRFHLDRGYGLDSVAHSLLLTCAGAGAPSGHSRPRTTVTEPIPRLDPRRRPGCSTPSPR